MAVGVKHAFAEGSTSCSSGSMVCACVRSWGTQAAAGTTAGMPVMRRGGGTQSSFPEAVHVTARRVD